MSDFQIGDKVQWSGGSGVIAGFDDKRRMALIHIDGGGATILFLYKLDKVQP